MRLGLLRLIMPAGKLLAFYHRAASIYEDAGHARGKADQAYLGLLGARTDFEFLFWNLCSWAFFCSILYLSLSSPLNSSAAMTSGLQPKYS